MPELPGHGLPEHAVQRAASDLAVIRSAAELLAASDVSREDRERWLQVIMRRVRTLDALLRDYEMHDHDGVRQ